MTESEKEREAEERLKGLLHFLIKCLDFSQVHLLMDNHRKAPPLPLQPTHSSSSSPLPFFLLTLSNSPKHSFFLSPFVSPMKKS